MGILISHNKTSIKMVATLSHPTRLEIKIHCQVSPTRLTEKGSGAKYWEAGCIIDHMTWHTHPFEWQCSLTGGGAKQPRHLGIGSCGGKAFCLGHSLFWIKPCITEPQPNIWLVISSIDSFQPQSIHNTCYLSFLIRSLSAAEYTRPLQILCGLNHWA